MRDVDASSCTLGDSDLVVAGAVVADCFHSQFGERFDDVAADGAREGDAVEGAVYYGDIGQGAVFAGGEEVAGGSGAGGG